MDRHARGEAADFSYKRAGVLDEISGEDHRAEIHNGKFQEKYGKYTLHRKEPIVDETKRDRALANASDTLEQLKNTSNVGLVGLYAYNPPTILEAARSKQLVGKVKIFGFDEDVLTLDGIDKGEIEGTIVQDPYNYGYESVKILAAEARGDTSKRIKGSMPYQVVTKEGGPDQTINGLHIRFPKGADYEATVRAQFSSVGKEAK